MSNQESTATQSKTQSNEWCLCLEYLSGTLHRCKAEWCDACQLGNHSGHTDSGQRCRNDNGFNADCKCTWYDSHTYETAQPASEQAAEPMSERDLVASNHQLVCRHPKANRVGDVCLLCNATIQPERATGVNFPQPRRGLQAGLSETLSPRRETASAPDADLLQSGAYAPTVDEMRVIAEQADEDAKPCPYCKGRGYVELNDRGFNLGAGQILCLRCQGAGTVQPVEQATVQPREVQDEELIVCAHCCAVIEPTGRHLTVSYRHLPQAREDVVLEHSFCNEQCVVKKYQSETEVQDGEDGLLPCPFCGSLGRIVEAAGVYLAECADRCQVTQDTPESARGTWNRRLLIDPDRTARQIITWLYGQNSLSNEDREGLRSELVQRILAVLVPRPPIDPQSLSAERCAEILCEHSYRQRTDWRYWAQMPHMISHENDVEPLIRIEDAQIIAAWLLGHGEAVK